MTCMVLGQNVKGIGIVVGDVMAVGFKMAGVQHVYTDPDKVKKLLENHDIGLLIVTSKIFESLDQRTRDKVLASVKPAVVILDASEEKMRNYVKMITGAEV